MAIKERNISEAKKSLLKSKIASFRIDGIENGPENLKRVFKEGLTEEYYLSHPLLMGLSDETREEVIWIDQETNLSSSSACSFGAQAQRELGVLMTEIASALAGIVGLNMTSDLKIVYDNLKKLEMENFKDKEVFRLFWNKKVQCTVQDYINVYESASMSVQDASERLETKIVSAADRIDRLEHLIKNQAILSTRIKNFILAGKIMYDRYSVNPNYAMMLDQFLKRLNDLETFVHVAELSMAQSAINYQNCVTNVRDAYSILQTTLPVWKSRHAQILSKWNLNGAKNDTPLVEAQNDNNFREVVQMNEEFYTKLSEEVVVETPSGTAATGPR